MTAIQLPWVSLFNAGAARAAKALSAPKNLFEIRLPAGDVQGFDIDAPEQTGHTKLWSRDWAGYDGVRLIGAGVDKTHVRDGWFGWTIFCHRFPGVIQIENLTLYAGLNGATHFGTQNLGKELVPKFLARLYDMKAVMPEPSAANGWKRGKWVLFGYQGDWHLRDVTLDAYNAREHAKYAHGYSRHGELWERVTVEASGAECAKTRSDSTETVWAGSDVWIIHRDSTYKGWFQPWSDRGGAGHVIQGGAANVLLERNMYYGGGVLGSTSSNARSHCVMVSAEPFSYDILSGNVDKGFGNGYVVMRQCGAAGFSEFDWNTGLVQVQRYGGSPNAARGVLIEGSGLWGVRMQAKISDIPKGQTLIQGCNTPIIRDYCGARGMDVSAEATFPGAQRKIPLSEGLHL